MLHDDDAVLNTATERHFSEIAAARLSRRGVLGGGLAAAAVFFAGPLVVTASAAPNSARVKSQVRDPRQLLGFDAIPLGFDDEVRVPTGYVATPFLPWGTPILGSFPAFVPGTPPFVPNGNTADQQAEQMGAHHDGMHYFPSGRGRAGSVRGLLVVNQEYVDEGYLHTGTVTVPKKEEYTLEMVRKSQNAHGVSVVDIARRKGEWRVVKSRLNRRITANTPMAFSGPAAGHRLLQTAADPSGRTPLGTFNNCALGFTSWGTYLTCEENFNGYFRRDDGAYNAEQTALNTRYGVGGDRYSWATKDPRFVVTPAQPNEPNRFGWVVEIDPFDPSSTPMKRTALGRMKHEGAFVHEARNGKVVVYMGDDQVNEYAFKFVSARTSESVLAGGGSPLDEGTLYVAKFNDDGSGQWLPLVHGQGPLNAANGFADQGDVLIKARMAATALGATPMDRPEWTSVDPTTGLVYLTLTNNKSSSKVENAANPRTPNPWGHIIRWREANDDHTATSFSWDLFVLAGPGRDSATPAGSTVLAEDAFGSPDGLWVDPDGRVWIQTDGTQPTGANDQMLAANPNVTDAQGVPEIRRFLTGVKKCEVTGVIKTPDQRTMFVNIQHPGQGGGSTWPNNDGIATPRSATVIVTRTDGGVIGA